MISPGWWGGSLDGNTCGVQIIRIGNFVNRIDNIHDVFAGSTKKSKKKKSMDVGVSYCDNQCFEN